MRSDLENCTLCAVGVVEIMRDGSIRVLDTGRGAHEFKASGNIWLRAEVTRAAALVAGKAHVLSS